MARRGSRQQLGSDHQHSLEAWAKEIPHVLEWVCGCSLLSPISFLGVSAIICNKREMRANDPCSAPVIHHTLPLLYTSTRDRGISDSTKYELLYSFYIYLFFKIFFKTSMDNCNLQFSRGTCKSTAAEQEQDLGIMTGIKGYKCFDVLTFTMEKLPACSAAP